MVGAQRQPSVNFNAEEAFANFSPWLERSDNHELIFNAEGVR